MSDYRALYRKWRPVDFDDVSGQRATTDILKYEVANNKISHAYLFCGSRGTGKTSCAKILAKAVNCLDPRDGNPCNCCEACKSIDAGVATDVIEMDAASNNGVGNVRDMKDEIAFTPAELKYRVYIIDEVHMMSGSAFNALLKTLEEPPSYVVFILATTEFNKLPTTIVSRCQRFDFRRMTTEVIVERLMKISLAEGIDITEEGAEIIARAAEGGMRDAVSLLELCAGSRRRIDAELVYETVGRGNRSSSYSLIEKIIDSDYSGVYRAVANTVMIGSDLTVFWQELLDAYRDLMVVKSTQDAKNYLDLTDVEYRELSSLAQKAPMSKLIYHTSVLESTLADLQRARESKRSVAEIALTRMCDARLGAGAEAMLQRIEELEQTVSRLKFGSVSVEAKPVDVAVSSAPKEAKTPSASPKPEPIAPAASEPKHYTKWARIVSGIEGIKPSICSPLSKAVALVNPDGSFVIKVDAFFVKIIGENRENMSILKGLIAECENKEAEKINISVVPKTVNDTATLADEIEEALG
ncbi:MAG: DNA polymerase III subunit gamma/tau [Ruminococcaceae bacterium]|nr:DNA polymerase III subunit gamma/tau [Oscillospiraceae bacterium]